MSVTEYVFILDLGKCQICYFYRNVRVVNFLPRYNCNLTVMDFFGKLNFRISLIPYNALSQFLSKLNSS